MVEPTDLGGRREVAGASSDCGAPQLAGVGISIPPFEYQTISDAIPAANFVWWDPTNGSDGDSGSTEVLAKQSFSAALAAVSSGGTIILAEGKHTVGQLDVNKACTIRSKPNSVCVLYREGTFKGALEGTWTWTQIDATREIWESPALGIADAATTVTKNGEVATPNNALDGILVIPDGGVGKHFMRLPWVDGSAILNQGVGDVGSGGGSYPGTGYPGPCLFMARERKDPAPHGKAQVRLHDHGLGHRRTPRDPHRLHRRLGRAGHGEPEQLRDPHRALVGLRWRQDPVQHHGLQCYCGKGINGALMGRLANINNAQNVRFDKGTFYPVEQVFMLTNNTTGFTVSRCRDRLWRRPPYRLEPVQG